MRTVVVVGGKSSRGQREFGEALNNGIHAQTQIRGLPLSRPPLSRSLHPLRRPASPASSAEGSTLCLKRPRMPCARSPGLRGVVRVAEDLCDPL